MSDVDISVEALTSVQKAFSKQAAHYDEDDASNAVLVQWRKIVYSHVARFMGSRSRILELNSGTGIDASYFVGQGHTVHATDVSPGMVSKIQEKIDHSDRRDLFSVQLCSFESLQEIHEKEFDYVFSNFGGLNCCDDLSKVARHLPGLLKNGGIVTWVVMPPVCPWELLRVFRGKSALRRLNGSAAAKVEGESIKTYYHSLSHIKKGLGIDFQLLSAEGLGALSPPPSSLSFINRYPSFYTFLKKLDQGFAKWFPFNRWADHIIVTFKYSKS